MLQQIRTRFVHQSIGVFMFRCRFLRRFLGKTGRQRNGFDRRNNNQADGIKDSVQWHGVFSDRFLGSTQDCKLQLIISAAALTRTARTEPHEQSVVARIVLPSTFGSCKLSLACPVDNFPTSSWLAESHPFSSIYNAMPFGVRVYLPLFGQQDVRSPNLFQPPLLRCPHCSRSGTRRKVGFAF